MCYAFTFSYKNCFQTGNSTVNVFKIVYLFFALTQLKCRMNSCNEFLIFPWLHNEICSSIFHSFYRKIEFAIGSDHYNTCGGRFCLNFSEPFYPLFTRRLTRMKIHIQQNHVWNLIKKKGNFFRFAGDRNVRKMLLKNKLRCL